MRCGLLIICGGRLLRCTAVVTSPLLGSLQGVPLRPGRAVTWGSCPPPQANRLPQSMESSPCWLRREAVWPLHTGAQVAWGPRSCQGTRAPLATGLCLLEALDRKEWGASSAVLLCASWAQPTSPRPGRCRGLWVVRFCAFPLAGRAPPALIFFADHVGGPCG